MIAIKTFYARIKRNLIFHVLFICFKDKYFGKNAGVILLYLKIYLKIFTIASTQHCSILWVAK